MARLNLQRSQELPSNTPFILPYAVLMVDDQYYCCDQGVWFVGATADTSWSVQNVPPAIYTIPPSSPLYNVTYATVQSSTPTSVVYSQTAGYSGEYVETDGVVMFGAGMSPDAALAAENEPYFYPAPVYYSYGCGAVVSIRLRRLLQLRMRPMAPTAEWAMPRCTIRPQALTPAELPPTVPTAVPVSARLTIPTQRPTPRPQSSALLTGPQEEPWCRQPGCRQRRSGWVPLQRLRQRGRC